MFNVNCQGKRLSFFHNRQKIVFVSLHRTKLMAGEQFTSEVLSNFPCFQELTSKNLIKFNSVKSLKNRIYRAPGPGDNAGRGALGPCFVTLY